MKYIFTILGVMLFALFSMESAKIAHKPIAKSNNIVSLEDYTLSPKKDNLKPNPVSKQATVQKSRTQTVINNAYTTVAGDTSGYTVGKFDVSDAGASTYTIPISVSPGTADLEPKIALSYNSQGSIELLGEGFSLEGLTSISRGSQTLAQDGQIKGMDLSASDTYSLDGERLVSVAGLNGVEYRTEQNAFVRIVPYSVQSGNPQYFKSWTKDGLEIEYGNTIDSRIEAQGSTIPLFWLVNKIRDTRGNYITFTYYEDNASGEYYPTKIEYTGNDITNRAPYASVVFNYNSRLDERINFVAGVQTKASKLLTSIQCFYQQNTLYRSYTLAYQNDTLSQISRLKSVTECGMNGECNNPTTFHWANNSNLSFTNYATGISSGYLNGNEKGVFQGDWDGDGASDLVVVDSVYGYNTWHQNTSSATNLNLNNTLGTTISNATLANNYGYIFPADFNADGFTDILSIDVINNVSNIFINNKATTFYGLNFTTYSNILNLSGLPSSGATEVKLGDFDGNGQTDVLFWAKATGDTRIFLNQTTTQGLVFGSAINNIITNSTLAGGTNLWVMDLNNDGLDDMVWYDKVSGQNRWLANQTTGLQGMLSFSSVVSDPIATNLVTGGDGISFGDWNGDGIDDVMWFSETNGQTRFFYNKGKILLGSSNFAIENSAILNTALVTGSDIELYPIDFNGDGLSDLVKYRKSTGNNHWFINKGKCNFSKALNPAQPSIQGYQNPITPANIVGGQGVSFGSFAKKGLVDAYWYNTSTGTNNWYKNSLIANAVIDTIRNGHGTKIGIAYKALLEDSVYIKERTAIFPHYDMGGKFFVTSSVSIDNGTVAGGRSVTRYIYKGAKTHLQGRGFRGFHEMITIDQNTGIKHREVYNRDYRYLNAAVDTSEVILPNGQVVSRDVNTNALIQFTTLIPNLYSNFPYLSQKVSKTWDVNGVMTSNTTYRQTVDDYGNVLTSMLIKGNGSSDSTYNTYDNIINNGKWLLGLRTSSLSIQSAANSPTITRQISASYNQSDGFKLTETTDANLGSQAQLLHKWTYDSSGNIVKDSLYAWNGQQFEWRVTQQTFDAAGRFVLNSTNVLGQTSSATYHQTLGVPLTSTDPNLLQVQMQYDGFGRKKKTILPDGNWTAIDYRICNPATNPPNTPAHAVTYTYEQSSNNMPSITWYDKLDRPIRTRHIGFNGTAILQETEYDNKGRTYRSSDPYFVGGTTLWTYHYYDILNRDTLTSEPNNVNNRTVYNGLEVTLYNALNQSKKVITDFGGRKTSVLDAQNNSLSYLYDAEDRMKAVINSFGDSIRSAFDIRGNLTQLKDPARGTENYAYNRWDEMIQKTDAKGSVTRARFDKAGRTTQRITPEDTTTYTWDIAPHGIGKLASESSTSGHSVTYIYDHYGRDSMVTEIINAVSYPFKYTYQSDGRLATTKYPTGFRLRNEYNAQGYWAEVRNDSTNQLYWQANSYNAKQQLLQRTLGNGLVTQSTYHPQEDWLQQTITTSGGTVIQNMEYACNSLGNLTMRKDNLQNLQENLLYDNLQRLSQSAIAGIDTVTVGYNVLGNIMSKSDVGTYSYGANGAGNYKLTGILPINLSVCIPSLQATFTYTSFDKVKTIAMDTAKLAIQYGTDNQRLIQKMYLYDSLMETKYFVGSLFERKVKNGLTQNIHYIASPEGIIGVYNSLSNGTNATHYWLKDHLGSLQYVTNSSGAVIESLSYDAWGKRRNSNWTGMNATPSPTYDRGYTGHEQLDIFSLINMNGRVYDPVLARFTSADPYIHDFSDLQDLNRFSYVHDNPLSSTDPSGYKSSKKSSSNSNSGSSSKPSLLSRAVGFIKSALGLNNTSGSSSQKNSSTQSKPATKSSPFPNNRLPSGSKGMSPKVISIGTGGRGINSETKANTNKTATSMGRGNVEKFINAGTYSDIAKNSVESVGARIVYYKDKPRAWSENFANSEATIAAKNSSKKAAQYIEGGIKLAEGLEYASAIQKNYNMSNGDITSQGFEERLVEDVAKIWVTNKALGNATKMAAPYILRGVRYLGIESALTGAGEVVASAISLPTAAVAAVVVGAVWPVKCE